MKKQISKFIVGLTSLALCLVVQAFAHVEEFHWNGETIHLETPTPLSVYPEGPLTALISSDQTGQYSLWITSESVAGLGIDQAILMASAILQKNGATVAKISKNYSNNRWIADIEGCNPQEVAFIKGRIILTDKNVFYLETLYRNSTERHTKFISDFSVK